MSSIQYGGTRTKINKVLNVMWVINMDRKCACRCEYKVYLYWKQTVLLETATQDMQLVHVCRRLGASKQILVSESVGNNVASVPLHAC